jgi:hypothetical protein
MARCPFAQWKPISGPSGFYTGGPFKIVHHTTEGSSAEGAFSAFATNRSDPHFTVDSMTIYQHIDTGEAARALRNAPGGVQTNRHSAIQIEVVGFAHRPKVLATLKNVQKLCNWLEAEHDILKVWPSGPPKPAVNGHDPGGHNRSVTNWDTKGGHFGHSQIPENTHWDPGYTAAEAAFVLADAGTESMQAGVMEAIALEDPGFDTEVSRMPDHADPNRHDFAAETAPAKKRAGKTTMKKAAALKTKAKSATTKKAAKAKPSTGKTVAKARPAKVGKKAKTTKKTAMKKASKKAGVTTGKTSKAAKKVKKNVAKSASRKAR